MTDWKSKYIELYKMARIVADNFQRNVDHDVWTGSTNDVDDLRDLLDAVQTDQATFDAIYPDDEVFGDEE